MNVNNKHEPCILQGFVEVLSTRGAEGWAWFPNNPQARTVLDVWVDGNLLDTIIADQYRADLQGAAIGDGAHGFSIQFPLNLVDLSCNVSFLVNGTTDQVEILSSARRFGLYEGTVEFIAGDEVRGWVRNPDNPLERIFVEVIYNKNLVCQVEANQFRADLAARKFGSGRHGFTIKFLTNVIREPFQLVVAVVGTSFAIPILANVVTGENREDNSVQSIDSQWQRSEGVDNRSFDSQFYKNRNSDVDFSIIDPRDHFDQFGWKEGRSPNEAFSVISYLRDYEDVLLTGINPFAHFVADGAREGRHVDNAPSKSDEQKFRFGLDRLRKHFNEGFYKSENERINFSFLQPLIHYVFAGWRLKKNPNTWFDVGYYLSAYPDVLESGLEPLLHYVDFGQSEGRQPNGTIRKAVEPSFDSNFYIGKCSDLRGQEPIEHYISFGWRQRFNPAEWFDVNHYLRLSPDVREAGIEPFSHYLTVGRSENRATVVENLREIPEDKNRKTLLFVGHDALHSGAQVVLLEIVKWFALHTRYPLKVLLLGLGTLARDYAKFADTFVLHKDYPSFMYRDDLDVFLRADFLACYVNTVASGNFIDIYDSFIQFYGVPIVVHVHEMEYVIKEFSASFGRIRSRAHLYIAVSEAVKTTLIETYFIEKERVILSNPFVSLRVESLKDAALLRLTSREELGLTPSSFVVMGCGSVYSRKGPDLFLSVAERIIASDRDSDIVFVWIGSGADLGHMRMASSQSLFDGRLQFIGFRSNSNELLAAADVFCLTSREDPFPLVCLEAAQYGVPTIFFAGASGIAEFVSNDAGTAVPYLNVVAMANAVRSYARSVRLRESHGSTARWRLIESYTTDRRVQEILLVIRGACDAPPDVSVIVPVYNHAAYIRERLDSILSQTMRDIEVVILDDCSNDDSARIATTYLSDRRVKVLVNGTNSGSPFKQWRLGLEQCSASLVWIAEGDDFCDRNLLAELCPSFDSGEVNVAFCKTVVVDQSGSPQPQALDSYFQRTDFNFQTETCVIDGLTAVNQGFGPLCLIVNASSALIRRSSILSCMDTATTFKMCGDWFVYLNALIRSKLFYSSKATNWFRRHEKSAVHLYEGTSQYFEERTRIANFIFANYTLPQRTARMIVAEFEAEWYRFQVGPWQSKVEFYRREGLKISLPTSGRAPLRVGFYVHGMLFSKGGIERAAANLANELVWKGHTVTIFCREWGSASPVYSLSEAVGIRSIFDENQLQESVSRLRREIAKSDLDVFVPMLSEWLFTPVIEAATGLGVRIIASEHNDPWKIEQLWWNREERISVFTNVDKIHLLLNEFIQSIPESLHSKTVILPNGIVAREQLEVPSKVRDESQKRIIGVGRLEKQKRFDRLVRAFAMIKSDAPSWHLDIFGEGGERDNLQNLIVLLDMSSRVTLHGNTDKVNDELDKSTIFVIPSEFEGFGLVVLEAKQSGLPCIGYTDCNGPNELIVNGVDGLLIEPDEDGASLAIALNTLIHDPDMRKNFGGEARVSCKEFYITNVAQRWEDLLYEVMSAA